jgi:hypothetical protein
MFSFLLKFKIAYSFDGGFSAFSYKLLSGCKTMAIRSSMIRTNLAKNRINAANSRKSKPKCYFRFDPIPSTEDFNINVTLK